MDQLETQSCCSKTWERKNAVKNKSEISIDKPNS